MNSSKTHKVNREERLSVNIQFQFPSPHRQKSYEDKRRKYILSVDSKQILEVKEEYTAPLELKLRSLIVIKKMFDKKIDSVLSYRVGENFCILRMGESVLKIAVDFKAGNVFEVLDWSSKIAKERLLEVKGHEE